RFKSCSFVPRLALESEARRDCGEPGIAPQEIKSQLLDRIALVAQLPCLLLFAHLQQSVFGEIQMVRLARVSGAGPQPRRLLLGADPRLAIRVDRLLPQPEHGISVRRHMLRMLGRGSDVGIFVGGVETTLRKRWVIVSVDEIMQYARVLR